MATMRDVVIVGGGHNALTAAAYLARSGRRVLLLERSDHLGGAAVSQHPFDGVAARLSRYAYLVSLLPRRIIEDLNLDLELVRRRWSSYTPDPADPRRGLLIDADADPAPRRAAFERVDAAADADAWTQWYAATTRLAEVVFPTLTQPLPTRTELRGALTRLDGERGARIWHDVVERPLGEALAARFTTDLVRGVVATDALIGTFAPLEPAPGPDDLAANRCYLYHVIGGGTGDWDVPVGGMGAVSAALERAARGAGADLRTRCEVVAVTPEGDVRWRDADSGESREVTAAVVLCGAAPAVLDRLLDAGLGLGPAPDGVAPGSRDLAFPAGPEGAQVKVNLVVERLPQLRDERVSPEVAFAGTFHVNETATQLDTAYAAAAAGTVPDPLPLEIYCHTLSDRSILSAELAGSTTQTLTVFGLHVPHRLVASRGEERLRAELGHAVVSSLDSVLGEPIGDVIALDAHGEPCVELRTTADLERTLAMPGGHIFHGPLAWPWREAPVTQDGRRSRERLSPAERWGVATRHERILMCGSGAVRGGAVSGVGGHNAAMAVLEADR